ncbi:unnamed protein product [Closterium sp. NIES-65]|nr:unnamed protein product [Closterium sp. NIES-65]
MAGMQYSHITLTTATRALNITDDPSFVPAGFPQNATPGFFFMPESFVHLLRYPLSLSLCDRQSEAEAVSQDGIVLNFSLLLGFGNNNTAVDPFTAFPTIDIAFPFIMNTSRTAHYYLKPREYLAQVSPSEYYMLVNSLDPGSYYNSFIGEPGLLGRYLLLDYTNQYAGWMYSPHCGAEPLQLPPSPPPPPSPVSDGATLSLSLLPAALSAALVLATSAALLAVACL